MYSCIFDSSSVFCPHMETSNSKHTTCAELKQDSLNAAGCVRKQIVKLYPMPSGPTTEFLSD